MRSLQGYVPNNVLTRCSLRRGLEGIEQNGTWLRSAEKALS